MGQRIFIIMGQATLYFPIVPQNTMTNPKQDNRGYEPDPERGRSSQTFRIRNHMRENISPKKVLFAVA